MLKKTLKENPIILFFSSFQLLHQLSIGVVVPFWSLILLESGWTTKEITYFFAVSSFVVFLFGGVIGKLADYVGKKKVIYIGLLIQMFFFGLYYFFMNDVYFILVARVFEVISFLCISVVGLGALEDFIEKDRGFWTGVFLGIGMIGAMGGPILAGYVANFAVHKILLWFSVVFAFIAILVLRKVPIKKNKIEHSLSIRDFNPFSEIAHFLSHKKLQGMALLGVLMNSKSQIYMIFFPIFVVESLGLETYVLGYLYSVPIFFHIFQAFFGKVFDGISDEAGVLFGVTLSSLAIFMFPYADNLISLFIMLCFYGIGSSIWNVSAWALMGNIGKKREREGEIVGTYVSIAKLGVFITVLFSANLIGSWGLEKTMQWMAILIFVGVAICYFFFQPIFHPKKKSLSEFKGLVER